jgi:hypothetical protein
VLHDVPVSHVSILCELTSTEWRANAVQMTITQHTAVQTNTNTCSDLKIRTAKHVCKMLHPTRSLINHGFVMTYVSDTHIQAHYEHPLPWRRAWSIQRRCSDVRNGWLHCSSSYSVSDRHLGWNCYYYYYLSMNMDDRWCWWWLWSNQLNEWVAGETEVLGENLQQLPVCPPQIAHDLTRRSEHLKSYIIPIYLIFCSRNVNLFLCVINTPWKGTYPDGEERLASGFVHFALSEGVHDTYWTRGWVGHTAGLGHMEKWKLLNLPGLELRPVGYPARTQLLLRLHSK